MVYKELGEIGKMIRERERISYEKKIKPEKEGARYPSHSKGPPASP